MNRYPLWKYIVIVVALVIGLIYTTPNFFGESPAVQISSQKATVKVDEQIYERVQKALSGANITPDGIFFEQGAQQSTIRVRFEPTQAEMQLQAKEVIERELNPNQADPSFVVALNLVPNTPQWLLSLHALPMYLGLDLRGGVHFLFALNSAKSVFVTPVLRATALRWKSLSAVKKNETKLVTFYAIRTTICPWTIVMTVRCTV